MVNTDKLRGKIVENRLSMDVIADALECNKSTLYRKIKEGGGGFTISEVIILASLLHLSVAEINDIFFAAVVA